MRGAKNKALQPKQQQLKNRKKKRPYLNTPVPLLIGLCDPLPSPRAVAIAASAGGSSTPASSFRTLRRTLWWRHRVDTNKYPQDGLGRAQANTNDRTGVRLLGNAAAVCEHGCHET